MTQLKKVDVPHPYYFLVDNSDNLIDYLLNFFNISSYLKNIKI